MCIPLPMNTSGKRVQNQTLDWTCSAVWPDLAKFRHFRRLLKDFWQNFEPTLANLWTYLLWRINWANFHRCKWSDIDQIKYQSGHTVVCPGSNKYRSLRKSTVEVRYAYSKPINPNDSWKIFQPLFLANCKNISLKKKILTLDLFFINRKSRKWVINVLQLS